MLTNPQISEFLMNSDKISWILREFLPEFWCSKVRLVRSLAHLTLQLCSFSARLRAGLRGRPEMLAGSIARRRITLSEARSRLYQRRSLQVNSHFSAFFKIYKIFTILRRSNLKILQNFVKFQENVNWFLKRTSRYSKNVGTISSKISWFWRKTFCNFLKFLKKLF